VTSVSSWLSTSLCLLSPSSVRTLLHASMRATLSTTVSCKHWMTDVRLRGEWCMQDWCRGIRARHSCYSFCARGGILHSATMPVLAAALAGATAYSMPNRSTLMLLHCQEPCSPAACG
jgi:hypothetical protein